MIELHESETVLRVVRRHWFVLLAEMAIPLLLFIVVTVAVEVSLASSVIFADGAAIAGSEGALGVFVISLAFLVMWVTLFTQWTNYYLDYWIITNERIIDVEQVGLFRREVSSFRLDRVQDITVEVKGIIATLLRFGDLHVQTAGERHVFTLPDAPHPNDLKYFIYSRHRSTTPQESGI